MCIQKFHGRIPCKHTVNVNELAAHAWDNNNNNNTSICKAHNVSIRAESEAPAVARWRGWLEG